MNLFGETIDRLSKAAEEDSRAVVSFSGGKDSLVCLDLASRCFKQVSAFFMYFIPGLECCELALDAARKRWGVTIVQYPHWTMVDALRNGLYCFNGLWTDDLPRINLTDIWALARRETKSRWVIRGSKDSDSVWRRRTLATFKQEDALHPIQKWTKRDVVAYLHSRKIPLPDAASGNATGIGLQSHSLLWLAEKWPNDFKKLCAVFPFAEAVVWREKWYGKAA